MTKEQKQQEMICHEIRMARLEKQISVTQAENYALRQRITELENEIRCIYPPLKEPVEVVGHWETTGNMEIKQ